MTSVIRNTSSMILERLKSRDDDYKAKIEDNEHPSNRDQLRIERSGLQVAIDIVENFVEKYPPSPHIFSLPLISSQGNEIGIIIISNPDTSIGELVELGFRVQIHDKEKNSSE